MVHLWRAEVNFQASALSFYRVDPRDQTQGGSLGPSVCPQSSPPHIRYLLLCSVGQQFLSPG